MHLIYNKICMYESDQRPSSLEEFIGQEQIKKNLIIYVSSMKTQGKKALDHIMLYGGPGKGKTSLAILISSLTGGKLKIINGTSLQKVTDITSMLIGVNEGDIIFIDEIHRLNKNVEEMLYSAMEDFKLHIIVGDKKPSQSSFKAKTLDISLKPFTIIGATTKYGLISQPLRNRFGIIFRFEDYNTEEMIKILENFGKKINTNISSEGSYELAIRSKYTPRIGLNLCKRILDFMYANQKNIIDKDLVLKAMEEMGIDNMGLESLDRKYLNIFRIGMPIGLNTISATLGETEETIEEILEPYLMKIGFIERTPKGRIVTENGYKHIKDYHKNTK